MNNVDKAAQIMYAHERELGRYGSEYIARALAQEGLLAPDLPEPDDQWRDAGEAWWNIADDYGIRTGNVWASHRFGTIELMLPERITEFTPAQARDLADKLRAAANHAETSKETNE